MSSEEVLYSLFYLLICVCIIYPPDEIISAGFTVPDLFSALLGSESEQFILYHIKRSSLTICIYSFIPIGYLIGLTLIGDETWIYNFDGSLLWSLLVTCTLILPISTAVIAYMWYKNDWEDHPIAKNVAKFANNNSGWKTVAVNINDEYRRVDKICIQTNPISKVIATENWIMKVTAIYIHIAHQSDSTLVVCQSDTHQLTPNAGETQYINININSSHYKVDNFMIRINSTYFKTLQDRVSRMITVLPHVKFHKTIMDQFTEVFKDAVKENPRFVPDHVPESCLACMQTIANVKLQLNCSNNIHGASENCETCYCRPMWCIDCMAKWFAAKQDGVEKEKWLSSKCTCPMCRATFCVLDVCLIDNE